MDLNERKMFRRARFIGEPAPDHKLPEDPMEVKLKGGVAPSERQRVHTATGY